MRRLGERPANIGFVIRGVLARALQSRRVPLSADCLAVGASGRSEQLLPYTTRVVHIARASTGFRKVRIHSVYRLGSSYRIARGTRLDISDATGGGGTGPVELAS